MNTYSQTLYKVKKQILLLTSEIVEHKAAVEHYQRPQHTVKRNTIRPLRCFHEAVNKLVDSL